MVTVGQEFKNYKELCKFLGESVYSGNSKRCQIKRWRRHFDFHTEGYRIIIDKVHKKPIYKETRGANNHKNLDIYLPYLHYCFAEGLNYNMGANEIISDTLHLINEDILKSTFNNAAKNIDFSKDEAQKFIEWVRGVRKYIIDTVELGLKTLQNDGLIKYNTAYAFISQHNKTSYMAYAAGFDDFIEAAEVEVCDYMNKIYHISKKMKGRQVKFIIFKNRSWIKEYRSRMIKKIKGNENLMDALKRSNAEVFYGIDFGSDAYPIDGYWKVWSVIEVEPPNSINIWEARQNFIDLIVRKTAKGRNISQEWIEAAFLS